VENSAENHFPRKKIVRNFDPWGPFFVHFSAERDFQEIPGKQFFETFPAENSNFLRHFYGGKFSAEFFAEFSSEFFAEKMYDKSATGFNVHGEDGGQGADTGLPRHHVHQTVT
jgi:hypothetical protein